MDFNGDGLLDQVVKVHGDSSFRVKFNLGTSFTDEVQIYRPEWDSSFTSRGSELQELINSCTDGINDMGIPLVGDVSPTSSLPGIDQSKFKGMINPLAIEDSTNIIDTGSNGTNLNYSLAYTYNQNKPKQAKIIGNMT